MTSKLIPVIAAAAVLVSVTPAAASIPPPEGGGSLPAVNMEAVLKAAQWDPRKPGEGITPGSKTSVLRVERALHAKGLLAKKYIDGHFGTSTVSAYAAWQRRLGYSGLGATGLPGPTSLQKLGKHRFTVTHVVRPGKHVSFDGKTVDQRTKNMLLEVQRKLGRNLHLYQGSYSTSDPSSANTHAGGGAVDVKIKHRTSAQRRHIAKVMRLVGFAAWVRNPSQGDWPWHIHAVAISDPDLSTEAQHQIGDYFEGKNGLANGAPDDGPQVQPIRTWEQYKRQRG